MKKALLIAEKPSERRIIEDVYNKHKSEIPYEITFTEQRGHLLTLKKPSELDDTLKKWDWETLPIAPEEYGGWQYKMIEEPKTGKFLTSKERYALIKKELMSGKYDFIINAGDADQEGELLVRIVLSQLKNTLPIKRYWSNDTTEEKVLDALKNLKDDDRDPMLVNLLKAAYIRQHSDWRFGMNISRAAGLKMGANCSCGRVKTPILAIVCKREIEIANFVPKTTYGVKALYSEDFEGQLFEKTEEESDDSEKGKEDETKGIVWFETKEDAEELISKLSNNAKVVEYNVTKVETLPPKLYKLASAQIDAGKLGYTSAKTLEIIQSLYEKGYISYPRTDCEYISSGENLKAMLNSATSVSELKSFVDTIDNERIGKVRGTKKWVNDAKLKEAGHSALVPTTKKPNYSELSSDEQTIYKLICTRFVSIFLPPLVQNKTVLIADINGHLFKSNGKTLIDKGYTELFKTTFTDMEIPKHSVGDVINVNDYDISEKTSTCPKRFTDATLIAACEAPQKYLEDKSLKDTVKKFKIGTSATRASIIEELIERNHYLVRQKDKKTEFIVPTESGMVIYDNLKDCDICKVDMTGEWEKQLEQVRSGDLDSDTLEKRMRQNVKDMVEQIKSLSTTSLLSHRAKIATCPECGGDIMSGPKGFYCSNYKEKDCKMGTFKMICDSKLSDEEFLKLMNRENIKKKLKKNGNTWEQELTYNFETHKVEFVKEESKAAEYFCPKCGAKMKEDSRTIKCENGDFTLWKTTGGKTLTENQILNLFENGDTGLIKGFKSKAGKSFDAHIIFKEDKSGTEYKFEERKKD